MKKKVIVFALVSAIVFSFAACKKSEDNNTTTQTTNPLATVDVSGNNTSDGVTKPEPVTMILTSAQGETMPTVMTTPFEITTQSSPTGFQGDFTIPPITPMNPGVSQITPMNPVTYPDPNTSSSTNAPATEPSDQETTQISTEPEDTTIPESERKYISPDFDVNSNRRGDFIYDIYPEEWDKGGGVASNSSELIVVEVNGEEKVVKGVISGKPDSAGSYKLTVYSSDLKLKDGDTLNITIPANFIRSTDGSRASYEINTTVTFNTGE